MQEKQRLYWRLAYWLLLIGWVAGALLNMMRVHGGFLTNYLADATFPAWFYIDIRGLWNSENKIPRLALVGPWFGQLPGRAAISIFLVGAITEGKTFFWPAPPLGGTFDPWDIFSYGFGLIVCYYFDRKIRSNKDR
jgi:hypothetical protein